MIADYLMWARDMSIAVETCVDCYNLASSSIEEPIALLLESMRRVHDNDLLRALHQPDGWGHPGVLDALGKRYNMPSPNQQILLTTGASDAYIIAVHSLIHAGDHAIIEAPTYQPFLKVLESIGAEVTVVPRYATNFALDLDAIEAAITPTTKLIVISNLHNPSATNSDETVLRDLAEIAKQHNLKVLVDEIYHDFVLDARCAALLDDVFITISSLTKVYGLSLLRCGWIMAAPEMIEHIRPVHALRGNGTSRLTHALVSVLLNDFDVYAEHWQTIVNTNRPVAIECLTPLIDAGVLIGNMPEQGCVYFPRVAGLEDVESFVQWLRDAHNIRVVPGHFFNAPAHIRIGFGHAPDETRAGLQRLADALRQYHDNIL